MNRSAEHSLSAVYTDSDEDRSPNSTRGLIGLLRNHSDSEDDEIGFTTRLTFSRIGDEDEKQQNEFDLPTQLPQHGDRMLCLSGNTHAGVAFQVGAILGLQRIGQLRRVGFVSGVGTGNVVVTALASAWKQTLQQVVHEDRVHTVRLVKSWSAITDSTENTSVGNKLFDLLAERLRIYVNQPHEWNIAKKRLCNVSKWLHAYNHEMCEAIYQYLDLSGVACGLSLSDLCTTTLYESEPIAPIFALTLGSSHCDDVVVLTNTKHDTINEPLLESIAIKNQIATELPLSPHEQDLARLLMASALPGPGRLFHSIEWHNTDGFRGGAQLTLSNASNDDPLAIRVAQAMYEQFLEEEVRSSESGNIATLARSFPSRCMFVIDAFGNSPVYESSDDVTKKTYRLQHRQITCNSDKKNKQASCVGNQPITCFDDHLLQDLQTLERIPHNARNMQMVEATNNFASTVTSKVDYTQVDLDGWYKWMRPFFNKRLSALPNPVFKAIANWGYLLAILTHGTKHDLLKLRQEKALLYPVASDHESQRYGIGPQIVKKL